ncbi:unnamed protein product [Pleuronectes platessa]|uniref:Uncharacterized protein n=1 Tax=Pleuronectes platessa TaxID=8262 RepID=A0A9N7UPS6_PLEPL|nr:unnamed protein product [Pleuronectes platessa]
MSKPVPPPVGPGVWMKEKAVERAAGVDVLSGVIQVSVRARKSSDCCVAKPEMKSALRVADWQFHRPPVTRCSPPPKTPTKDESSLTLKLTLQAISSPFKLYKLLAVTQCPADW